MQKLNLSIPEPCHENWHHMTPTEQGRFCNACAKEVIDFSTMTDIQVLNYFTNLTHEKVCGRALPEQLDRTLSRPEHPKKKIFWYWNYIVMFLMFFTKGNSVKAQSCVKPATELSPVKNLDVRGEVVVGGEIKRNARHPLVTGKVTDKNGNPVSFASIKVKGTNTGVSADAGGAYSIRVNSTAILVISGAGFKEAEVVVGRQSFINTVMEKGGIDIKEVVVTFAMGGVRSVYDVTFVVKDIQTGLPINKAELVIIETDYGDSAIAFTDDKGNYKANAISVRHNYKVKVMAEGYRNNKFTIKEIDFQNGKKEWEVLLRKQKSAFKKRIATAVQNIKGDVQVRIVGQTFVVPLITDSLYVIDGIITTKLKADNLKPEDISEITRLGKNEAAALFGSDGANGAIVITTRKAKEIKMKEVVVTSDYGSGCHRTTRGGVSFTNTYEGSFLGDTIATVKTLLKDSIKVYPNPVQRSSTFSIALKLKEAGNYQIQFTDAIGRIVLQKQINSVAKNHIEIVQPQNWSSGIYNVRIFNKNQLISKCSFIFR